jgi:DNA-binding Xre family transcriptional regulator
MSAHRKRGAPWGYEPGKRLRRWGTGNRALNKLTDQAIRASLARRKAGAGPRKLPDDGGLSLTLTTAGAAVWRIKYWVAGREGLASVGHYPGRVERSTAYEIAKRPAERISTSTLYRLARAEGPVELFPAELLDALCEVLCVEPGALLEREKKRKARG